MENSLSNTSLKIGFHYHVPVYRDESGNINAPSFFGSFLDGLAGNCNTLYCLLFSALEGEKKMCNYTLVSKNIVWIDLGPHVSIPGRYSKIVSALRLFKNTEKKVDVMLIRTPTPYLPFFKRSINKNKLAIYVVGDYSLSKDIKANPAKKLFTQILYKFMSGAEQSVAKNGGLVITNSRNLTEYFGGITKNVAEVKSTTLSSDSFFKRDDCCTNSSINLLYTGRLEPLKNIPLIFEAVKDLNNTGLIVNFNIANVLDAASEKYIEVLKKQVVDLGIENRINFLGQKKNGEELNSVYRQSDIFIIASLSEGFPRVIWEAMANSLPVIATKVGSIPFFLQDKENVLLIDTNSKQQIIDAVKAMVNDAPLRKKIIQNAYLLAADNTIEIQSKKLVSTLATFIKNNK